MTAASCWAQHQAAGAGWIINVRGSAIILGVVILSTIPELPTLQDIKHNNTAAAYIQYSAQAYSSQHERKHASALTAKLIKRVQRWQVAAAISFSKQCNRIHQANKLSLPSLGCKLCRGSQWRKEVMLKLDRIKWGTSFCLEFLQEINKKVKGLHISEFIYNCISVSVIEYLMWYGEVMLMPVEDDSACCEVKCM